ncbi:MAG: hypothetical protein QOK47_1109 [Actinomycetota bacterium]|nr:hypothetical protein [Actinomycetota bacterium]
MGIGASLFLIAIGAILAFAVNVDTEAVDLDTIGVILMIVGALGGILSMMFWSTWGGWGNRSETVVRDRDVVREREVV